MRNMIDYGIDLGTTNSAICRMDRGEIAIIKTDTLKDTLPSCVAINKKGTFKTGDGAFNTLKQDKRRATKSWQKEASNTFIEFKRTMGTDTEYFSSNLGSSLTSEDLSAEVLKTLKSFVTDETVKSVVITVPAKFTVNQKTATLEAAQMAGFEQCELLQEPIAAAMAYGIKGDEKDGLWIVFDFGGGTFDAALLKVEDGIMQVFDTEGDNYLGGKNLDYAIVDEILIPYLQENYDIDSLLDDPGRHEVLRDAMKTYAEEAKNQLSFKESEDIVSDLGDLGEDDSGEDIELDLTITQDEVARVTRPYFQKAVDICHDLLRRNNISKDQITKLILVGGPTHSPLIRRMLSEQITPKVDTSIDPMTAVATGAALYASTIRADLTKKEVKHDVVKLNIGCETTSVEETEWASIGLDEASSYEKVWVELTRSDNAWSSGKLEINKTGDVVELHLVQGRPNTFDIKAYDQKGNALECFPKDITVIQGAKVGAAPLPYNIGIGVWNEEKECAVFRMAKGLEKNRLVPAVGVVNGLTTTEVLHPGVASDRLCIPVYQTDDFTEAEGKTASLYEHVADVVITGAEVNRLIEKNSPVDVTLRVDSSEQMTLEVLFSEADYTVEKVLDTSRKQSIEDAEDEIERGFIRGKELLEKLEANDIDTSELQEALSQVREEHERNTETKMTLQHLKEVLRRIESLESSTQDRVLVAELNHLLDQLKEVLQKANDEELQERFAQLQTRANEAIQAGNVPVLKQMIEQTRQLYIAANLRQELIRFVIVNSIRFSSIDWKNREIARRALEQAENAIHNNAPTRNIHRAVMNIIEQMPESEAARTGGLLK